ncbi:hypothetical protein SAMN04487969_10910 [Paenibacillus algorifonticola]|uniref:Uncharacterized protein n=1 Tax=Paenibacillus algorifonticola TaxID=684063 RepID=A0A1I2EBM8_9BACL|nr:hypothetical protein [Paenibacillus algorifonticola]SFE90424.1 hypothetical protein SAMN04487969_10910 [Paenibacillus algorifonticola]
MFKLRIMPILLTAAASALVLFGGWLIYHQVAFAAPLAKAVDQIEGIASSETPIMDTDRITFPLTLTAGADLKHVYETIVKQSKSVAQSRDIQLDIANTGSNAKLDQLWSSSLFKVAEAMEHKNYSAIPETLKALADEHSGVEAITDIDDSNIYITLKDGTATKYIVLPRVAAQLEVSSYA